MKKIALFVICLFCLLSCVYSQTGSTNTPLTTWYEWDVPNTGSSPGERIVAYINSGTISTYTGCSIIGQVIDCNGNWGYALPTVANFSLFTDFARTRYGLRQDISTPKITLELKEISSTQWALVANCSSNCVMRILFRVAVADGPTITLGSPYTVDASGTMLLPAPVYQNNLTGNLAVNVTNTSGASNYNLAVGGSAIAQAMTVKLQNSWPDYVFRSGYDLPSLDNVKTYIDQNHHLPGIPTEKEVSKNGINLGETDKTLVRKVEELTLYLIKKDAQIKADEETIKSQQQEMELLKKQIEAINKQINSKVQ